MKYRQWCNMIVMIALIALWSFTPLTAQEMKGLGMPGMQQMKEMAGPGQRFFRKAHRQSGLWQRDNVLRAKGPYPTGRRSRNHADHRDLPHY